MLEKLDEITLEEINESAKLVTLEPRLITSAYPSNAQIHVNEEDVLQVIEQVKQQTLSPYESKEEILKIMDPNYPKGEVASKEKDPSFEMTRYALSNGMKVIMMPTEFKKDEVIIYSYADGGLNAFEGNDFHSALIAGNYAIESGIDDCSHLQISDLLHKKAIRFSHRMRNSARSISGSCTPNHLDFLFQAIHGVFTAIEFDETVWDRVLSNEKEYLNNRSNDPKNVFNDFVDAINFQDHELLKIIDLDLVDPQKAKAAYEVLFSDPSEFTFVIVGSVDHDLIEDQILTCLGSIPLVKTNAQFHEIERDLFPKETIVESFYRGNHEECDIVTSFQCPCDPSVNKREFVYHVVVLNSILETRLLERIRCELGASYSVNVSVYHPFFPDYRNGVIEMRVTTNINNKLQVQSIILEEVKRLTTGEILQSEIDKCREIERTHKKKSMQTNQGWLWIIRNHLRYGISMQETVDYEVYLQKLTSESLKAFANSIYKDTPYTQLSWEQEG